MKTKMAAENSHLIIMWGLITGNKCLQKDYFHIQSSFKVYSKCDNCFIVFVNFFLYEKYIFDHHMYQIFSQWILDQNHSSFECLKFKFYN